MFKVDPEYQENEDKYKVLKMGKLRISYFENSINYCSNLGDIAIRNIYYPCYKQSHSGKVGY